jgi:hypothetical protein
MVGTLMLGDGLARASYKFGRFTKLPSGFVHELPQHVKLDAKTDKETGVPRLDFNKFCCGACLMSSLYVMVNIMIDHDECL